MPLNKPRLFLLAYDIADPKRLVRVHRACRQWGVPVQYSVFLVPLTHARIGELFTELEALIDKDLDDIRLYPLPARPEIVALGRRGLPEDIALVGGAFGGEQIAALAAARGARG
jgi:CRISPR-associated protein Cas2